MLKNAKIDVGGANIREVEDSLFKLDNHWIGHEVGEHVEDFSQYHAERVRYLYIHDSGDITYGEDENEFHSDYTDWQVYTVDKIHELAEWDACESRVEEDKEPFILPIERYKAYFMKLPRLRS